jgi:hypothetical protein
MFCGLAAHTDITNNPVVRGTSDIYEAATIDKLSINGPTVVTECGSEQTAWRRRLIDYHYKISKRGSHHRSPVCIDAQF